MLRTLILALICVFTVASRLQAASAVARGISPNGKPYCSYWKDPKLTETEVRSRALQVGRVAQARNIKIVASTPKLGFGVIVMFQKADKTLDLTTVLAAPSWEIAVRDAKARAKSLGGIAFKIVRGWNDGIKTNQPIVLQKL